ncbi:MAG: ABC transporter permease subunit [Acidimicrobiaceae bacterium]|nr:ABC transporter permease subunit [Acidimicrobiaceae bacterium]
MSIVRAEWLKLRSYRSAFVSLAVFVALGAGFGALTGWGTHHAWATMAPVSRATFDPLATSLSGIALGPIALGGLAVGFITNEFATGHLQGTLLAVPNRTRLVLSKIVVLGVPVALFAILTSFAAVLAFNATIDLAHERVVFAHPGVTRSLVLAGLYIALAVVFAFAMGLLLRKTALALSLFIGIYLAVPIIVQLLPWHWVRVAQPYMIGSLGASMLSAATPADGLNVWVATGLFTVYTVVLTSLGVVRLLRTSL